MLKAKRIGDMITIAHNDFPRSCYGGYINQHLGIVLHTISLKWIDDNDPFNLDRIVKEILIKFKLSYHIIIDRKGIKHEFVPDNRKAWHAGYSRMHGKDWCNGFCLGISLLSRGYEKENIPAYEDNQIISLVDLCKDKLYFYKNMSPEWILSHKTVRENWNQAHPKKIKDKKVDPENFPWADFHRLLGD